MEFSRQEYWSGWPFPSPGDLPNPGIEPRSPTLQADSLPAEAPGKPKNTGVGSSSRSSQPRNQTWVSCIAGRFFTTWAMRAGLSKLFYRDCCSVSKSGRTLGDPMDCSPPGSSVPVIPQGRILEWVAISFSRGSSWPRVWTHVSCTAEWFFTTEPPGKPFCHHKSAYLGPLHYIKCGLCTRLLSLNMFSLFLL